MPGQDAEIGSDGLPVLVQGGWSEDKLFFVKYFSSLFNGGMKYRWAKRAYVDIFAGPGMCKDRGSQTEFDGSALAAMKCETPFTHLYLNDINSGFIDALASRQQQRHPDANVEYLRLDCNEAVKQIAGKIPRDALTLAFIDPWNYEIKFDSLGYLGRRKATDLIVTFHTGAIKRNAHQQLEAVDAFLNDNDWRTRYFRGQFDSSNPPTTVLIETFQKSLRDKLGYLHFGDPMCIKNSRGLPIFYLLFASKHPKGLDFWEKSSTRLRSGQRFLAL